MIFTVSAQHGSGYLIVIGSGEATLADLCGAGSFAAETARRMGYRGLVFDMLGAHTHMSDADRREVARHFSQQFQGLACVAFAISADQHNGVGEAEAKQAGLNLAVFAQLETATDWLRAQLRA